MWLTVNWRWELKGLERGGDYVYLCARARAYVCVCVCGTYAPSINHQQHVARWSGCFLVITPSISRVPTVWSSLLFHVVAYWNPLCLSI